MDPEGSSKEEKQRISHDPLKTSVFRIPEEGWVRVPAKSVWVAGTKDSSSRRIEGSP